MMIHDNKKDRLEFMQWLQDVGGGPAELYSGKDMQMMHVVYWAMLDKTIPCLAQSAVMLREAFSDPNYQMIYDTIGSDVGGFPEVARYVGEAAVLHDRCIPDLGETFDWVESMEHYACFITDFVRDRESWPSNEDLENMAMLSVEATRFKEGGGE